MNEYKIIVEYDTLVTGFTDKFIAQDGIAHNEYIFNNEKAVQDVIKLLDTLCKHKDTYFIPKENNND